MKGPNFDVSKRYGFFGGEVVDADVAKREMSNLVKRSNAIIEKQNEENNYLKYMGIALKKVHDSKLKEHASEIRAVQAECKEKIAVAECKEKIAVVKLNAHRFAFTRILACVFLFCIVCFKVYM